MYLVNKMKIDINKEKRMLQGLIILICIVFTAVIGFKTRDMEITIITISFSCIIITVVFLYEKLFRKYMYDIFSKLSDMLATISDMKENEFFSTIEDSMFAKLQWQTIKLTKLLKSQNKRIEDDKNEIKSLISDIAHQLKTPLTNMKMYEEFLQDESLSEEERKEFNEIILISLNKLSFLVESMIKMSRLESGVINLKPELNDLNSTLLLAIGQAHQQAKNKNINITLDEKSKVNISHDKNWTTEALFNIVDNAIKYTKDQGEVNISILSYEMFSRIDISDNGIGIEEDELPKIFSRFYRGKNAQDFEGIGIGLYLSREIISKQGGYIKVKSDKQGSTFSIFLPNKFEVQHIKR